jgi:hypothetical protein
MERAARPDAAGHWASLNLVQWLKSWTVFWVVPHSSDPGKVDERAEP